MPAYGIEIIVNRQLADGLTMPVFITDTVGNLLFYNTPAEDTLSERFEETGEMPVDMWPAILKPVDKFANLCHQRICHVPIRQ